MENPYISPIYWVFMGYNPQESLENTISTLGTLLGVHPSLSLESAAGGTNNSGRSYQSYLAPIRCLIGKSERFPGCPTNRGEV